MGDGSRCYLCKGEGWLEVLGAGEVDPNVYAYVPTTERNAPGLRPREGAGLRLGHGRRADRDAQARHPRPAAVLTRTTCASWSSSDEGPAASWLREYCDPELDARGDRGAPDDDRHEGRGDPPPRRALGGATSSSGACSSAEQHPDADRLKVCSVDLGDGEGAGHDRVRRAQRRRRADGRRRAPGRGDARRHEARQGEAARRRLRGMILAEDELEIGSDHATGIMVLDELTLDARAGARHAAGGGAADRHRRARARDHPQPARLPGRLRRRARAARRDRRAARAARRGARTPAAGGRGARRAEVAVECPDLCPRFTARVFEDVTIAPSPPWLKARLSAAGQRPINNVVDITNYAMLLTGQPLHAFDLDRVAGGRLDGAPRARGRAGADARRADAHARRRDGRDRGRRRADLDRRADGRRALGGRARRRTRVLLEVATWNGPNIHRTSWALGLRSEASARFEKGLAPEQCMHAQAVATRLMIELCGATLAPGTIDVGGERRSRRAPIRLRERRVRAILGVAVPRGRQARDPRGAGLRRRRRRGRPGRDACRRCGATTSPARST